MPARKVLYFSAPADAAAGVRAEDGRPPVELRSVGMCRDYLDNTDILLRGGRNELGASWRPAAGASGYAVGITQALTRWRGARRLPSAQVVHSSSPDQPARIVQVDIDAFDIQPEGHCVLTARWTIQREDRRSVAVAERGTFVTQSASVTDTAIVSAMDAAVGQLADNWPPHCGTLPARTALIRARPTRHGNQTDGPES